MQVILLPSSWESLKVHVQVVGQTAAHRSIHGDPSENVLGFTDQAVVFLVAAERGKCVHIMAAYPKGLA